MSRAQVVRERTETADINYGPSWVHRVGFRIDDRVFWVGTDFYPGPEKSLAQFKADEALSQQIVERFNVGEQP